MSSMAPGMSMMSLALRVLISVSRVRRCSPSPAMKSFQSG